jgi:hypothetical protein
MTAAFLVDDLFWSGLFFLRERICSEVQIFAQPPSVGRGYSNSEVALAKVDIIHDFYHDNFD